MHFKLECVKIILEGNKLICEYTGSKRVDYLYDGNGILYGLIYNGNKYFYLRDHLANILGIIDSSGNLVVSYDYSAYGNLKSITGSMATTLGKDNHMRYKGYYFDEETGFYYCKSRYYVPDWCRWLNADSPAYLKPYSATGNNLFVYCKNNPVMYKQEFLYETVNRYTLHCNSSSNTSEKIDIHKGTSDLNNFIPQNPNSDESIVEFNVVYLHEGQLIRFDYSENSDFSISTSFSYADELYAAGLPDDRTYEGVWLELIAHYVVSKADVLDITDRDDIADIGSYKYDNNAYIWESIAQAFRSFKRRIS